MNLAIIGATGNVGRKTIEVLEKSSLKINTLFLIASKKSVGKKLLFKKKEIVVEQLEQYDFAKAEITIFAAGSEIAKKWIPEASKKTIVIDNSSFFRMRDDVPLIVPEVNSDSLNKHKNIISNPNCSTIQMVLALKPLHDEYKIKRVVVSTYQAVSGAGKKSVDELGKIGLEEERRLAYVGVTRAKKEAYLSFAMKRAYHGDWMEALPSRFINEIPEEGVERNEINIDKTIDDFEFNQDNSIEFEEEYRSPGWDRYKKNKILKWKK